ncbi:hypothetical protein PFMALIP_00637, partial [Plasmodium falciparum MaliPS096_E11]
MSTPGHGGGGGRGGKEKKEEDKYKYVSDVKHLLDRIGEDIYKIANEAALKRSYKDLHGLLTSATYPKDERHTDSTPSKSCDLHYNFHTNVTSNVIEPCKHKSEKRFSDTQGAECDNNKIRGNDQKQKIGACAPFRRLHLCDKNIQQIKTENITTHNLLVDVCQAAKFEGESIRGYYALYDTQYPSSGSTICTALARSFADIGDIIRGKDLYLGNKKRNENLREKEKLEGKLKSFFEQIYNSLEEKERNHYNDDAPDFYQLREDWWNANRQEIWKAITCDDRLGGNAYFRATCDSGDGKRPSRTNDKCRCPKGDQVPTYFDYVPQYLRWFEEWAEDFCRKRKKKIENAIKNCRGDNGKELYCDLNGYDCEKTAKGKNQLVEGADCKKCSVACNPFVEWLDNQQKEFEKQKKKYGNEINKKHDETTLKIGKTTINNLYVKDFYEKLREDYGNVDDFLEKLSKEGICQSAPHVEEERADPVDFKKEDVGEIFSRTKYCRACPLCGVTGGKGNWTDKKDSECEKKEENKTYDPGNRTDIPKLPTDKGKKGILKKYETFCANGKKDDQINNWQCYYDEEKLSGQNNNCILGKWENFTGNEDVTSYNVFFYSSIIEMLNDSIEWKDKLNICINNKMGNCRNVCKEYCECYRRWVGKKREEWENIKIHFRKQKDIGNLADREMTLTGILNVTFLDDIEDAYPVKQQREKIKNRLKDKMKEDFIFETPQTSIDKFLQEEEQFAEKCLKKHKCQETQPINPAGDRGPGGRSAEHPHDQPQPPPAPNHDNDSDEEIEEEEKEEEEEEVAEETREDGKGPPQAEDTQVDGPAPPTPAPTVENICATVKNALNNKENLNAACTQKYAPPQRHWGWKCIPTSGGEKATSSESEAASSPSRSKRGADSADSAPSGTNQGSICVPPRRRRLYIQKLQEWEKTVGDLKAQSGDETTEASVSQETGEASSQIDGKPAAQPDPLLKAFVESAAVETFFLWHNYKQENKTQNTSQLPLSPPVTDSDDNNPEQELQKGHIPPDFLRLMFYTLGDYRDICIGGDRDIVGDTIINNTDSTEKSSDKATKISDVIKQTLESGSTEGSVTNPVTSPGSSSGNDPKTWWELHGPHIWNGMICALTYKTDTSSGTPKVVKIENPENLLEKIKENGKETGEKEGEYHYSKVTLENSDTQPRTNDTINNPKLTDFVKRPPYFRYLEEWGQNF